jgi:hypothetical protein
LGVRGLLGCDGLGGLWVGFVKCAEVMEKQIPFGDDNQNGKSKGNDRSNSNDKCKGDGWLAVYIPTLGAKSAPKMGHPVVRAG